MANSPEVGIVYQALWRAGAVVTPAIFLLSAEDLRHVLRDSEAAAVITTPEFADEGSGGRRRASPVSGILICTRSGDGFMPLAELEQREPAPIVPRRDDELAALLYTGGTTGRAKGVMLTHANLYYTGAAGHERGVRPGINRGLIRCRSRMPMACW